MTTTIDTEARQAREKHNAYHREYYQKNKARLTMQRKVAKAKRDERKKMMQVENPSNSVTNLLAAVSVFCLKLCMIAMIIYTFFAFRSHRKEHAPFKRDMAERVLEIEQRQSSAIAVQDVLFKIVTRGKDSQ